MNCKPLIQAVAQLDEGRGFHLDEDGAAAACARDPEAWVRVMETVYAEAEARKTSGGESSE